MKREEILAVLKELFANVNPRQDLGAITAETRLFDDLGLDSLTMLLLSLSIESRFNIQIEPGAHFVTVGDVLDYIGGAL